MSGSTASSLIAVERQQMSVDIAGVGFGPAMGGFLATLSRFPDEKERRAAIDHVKETGRRKKAFVDMLWALLNTREFIVNH